jgi:hypothetical protein
VRFRQGIEEIVIGRPLRGLLIVVTSIPFLIKLVRYQWVTTLSDCMYPSYIIAIQNVYYERTSKRKLDEPRSGSL